ncbi:adenosine kinase [Spirochaetota bacterium]
MENKILGFGSPLMDILSKASDEEIKSYGLIKGGMTLVDLDTSNRIQEGLFESAMSPGGSAGNTITACARLGLTACFFGKIADDEIGKKFMRSMKESGVMPHLIKSTDKDKGTGRVISLITEDSERTFATHLGAAVDLSPEDIPDALFDEYKYVYIEGYLVNNRELITHLCRRAKEHDCTIAIDLASFNIVEENKAFFNEMIDAYIDIVFANEEEAEALTGYGPEDALRHLQERCSITVVKAGDKGSYTADKENEAKIEIEKVKAVDTTGAGDFYSAGFLYGVLKGEDIGVCGKIGSILSREVVQQFGTALDDSIWEKIKKEAEGIRKE